MTSSQDIVSNPFTVTLIRIKARQLCKRSDFSRSDYNDLRQNMRLYLLKKAHLFDPTRGNIEAFVTNAINTWVAMHLRYRSRDKRREPYKAISLESTPVECNGDITTLSAMLDANDHERRMQTQNMSQIEHFELREAIGHVMQNLDPDDQALLTHVASHGVASAARERNVSRRQINNAIARMRPRFEEAGLGSN